MRTIAKKYSVMRAMFYARSCLIKSTSERKWPQPHLSPLEKRMNACPTGEHSAPRCLLRTSWTHRTSIFPRSSGEQRTIRLSDNRLAKGTFVIWFAIISKTIEILWTSLLNVETYRFAVPWISPTLQMSSPLVSKIRESSEQSCYRDVKFDQKYHPGRWN